MFRIKDISINKAKLEEGTKPTPPHPSPQKVEYDPYRGTKPTPPPPNNGDKNLPPVKIIIPKK